MEGSVQPWKFNVITVFSCDLAISNKTVAALNGCCQLLPLGRLTVNVFDNVFLYTVPKKQSTVVGKKKHLVIHSGLFSLLF